VSIGEVLADARCQLGISVSEVSRRTRIRKAIIWGVEQDDYSVCGGDFYARGHIRAIAQAVGVDSDPLIQEYDATQRTAEDVADLVALHPAAPTGMRPYRRMVWITMLGVAVLVILGWAGCHFVSAARHAAGSTAVAAADRAPAHHQAGPGTPRPSPHPTPSPSRSTAAPVPPAVPAQALTPVRAAAFGPGGTAQGDDPRHAGRAIDGARRTAWLSDWYTTAAFGNLQAGTGLLVDMGRRVTITAAQVTLGGLPGADLQLRAGNVPALADLREVAGAADAGGTVNLRLAGAVRARYVLIWFTRLPPDTSGTFQASVASVALQGQR